MTNISYAASVTTIAGTLSLLNNLLLPATKTTISAGYLGYQMTATGSATGSMTTATNYNIASIALPAGTFILIGTAQINAITAGTILYYKIGFGNVTLVYNTSLGIQQEDVGFPVAASYIANNTITTVMYNSVATTVYLIGSCSITSGTYQFTGTSQIKAFQIA